MAERDRPVDEFAVWDVVSREGPAAGAAMARELLASGRLPKNTSRADLLHDLGRMLLAADDPEAAETALRDALADGGPTREDPRIRLAEALGRRGDRAGCDAVLDAIRRERPSDAWVYDDVAEVLWRLGDTTAALRWANTGAFRLIRQEERLTDESLALLSLRWRLRRDMGFPDDEYDELAQEWVRSDEP